MKQLFISAMLSALLLYSSTIFADQTVARKIISDPIGADVFLENENNFVGKTPVVIELPVGITFITLKKEGYYNSYFDVKSGKNDLWPIEIKLKKKVPPKQVEKNNQNVDCKGIIFNLKTEPDEAKVYIGKDNDFFGITPLIKCVPEGRTQFLIERNGYHKCKFVVELDKDNNEPMLIKLTPLSEEGHYGRP
jgi:hypothetical protein